MRKELLLILVLIAITISVLEWQHRVYLEEIENTYTFSSLIQGMVHMEE